MSINPHPKYEGADWVVYDSTINSTAKQKFSFPKSDRFRQAKKPLNDKVSYDLPSTLIPRATSFGFGERSGQDFSRKSIITYLIFFSFSITRYL